MYVCKHEAKVQERGRRERPVDEVDSEVQPWP